MKNIIKSLLVPAVTLMALPLMVSCDTDTDSNPTLQEPTSFVLNTPAYATEGNVYDLANCETVNLTTSQPDYGFPLVTDYQVQVSIDQAFTEVTGAEIPEGVEYRTLADSYQQANMNVDATQLNNAIVEMYQAANDGNDPSGIEMPAYIRLVAHVSGSDVGFCYSNVITLPRVVVSYIATMPTNVYLAGPSIHGGESAKQLGAVYGLDAQWYGMVYMTAGATLKWGAKSNAQSDNFTTSDDQANAGLTQAADGSLTFANAGWYAVNFHASIEDNSIRSTITVYPGTAYVTGAVADNSWSDPNTGWELTPPADASGEWVSPAFAAGGELRAYIKIPGFDWWRTEFTIYNGNLFWRNADIVQNWATSVGSAYSVTCTAGQRLYVDFDHDTGRVE